MLQMMQIHVGGKGPDRSIVPIKDHPARQQINNFPQTADIRLNHPQQYLAEVRGKILLRQQSTQVLQIGHTKLPGILEHPAVENLLLMFDFIQREFQFLCPDLLLQGVVKPHRLHDIGFKILKQGGNTGTHRGKRRTPG